MSRLKERIMELISSHEQYRLGKVLTIIDATVSDREQRKAIKDLVKEAFWSRVYLSHDLPDVIEQFTRRMLGVGNIFNSSEEQKIFRTGSHLNPGDTLSRPTVEDLFPIDSILEDSGEANSSQEK
jgi:hypothetical protein